MPLVGAVFHEWRVDLSFQVTNLLWEDYAPSILREACIRSNLPTPRKKVVLATDATALCRLQKALEAGANDERVADEDGGPRVRPPARPRQPSEPQNAKSAPCGALPD